MPRPIVLILGPTAGGKTRLAIDLANALPGGGECLSADSVQVYREMDIGAAKPTPEEQSQAPHHLLDLADPAEDGFTVDTWLKACDEAIADVRSRDRWPIVVGGTNLYIQALLYGLFDGPEHDPDLRAALQAADLGDLREELERVDPDASERIHRNDRKRTIRAIEVFRLTGKPISAWQQEWSQAPAREDILIVGLDYPVDVINRRINARVKAMLADGLLDEVRRLHEAGRLGEQARQALGYAQLIEHLEGRASLEEAVEAIKIGTRRFAKQQRTWLRRFRALPRSRWIPAADMSSEVMLQQALAAIDGMLAEPMEQS